MHRIFISYARDMLPVAKSIADDLALLDWEVWFDQELSGGQSWWDAILEQIRGADVALAVVSPESLDSQACKLELQYAQAVHRHVLPVMVSDEVDVTLLPSYLAQVQFVDRRTDSKQALLSLLRALTRLPQAPALPVPLPAPPLVPVSYLSNLKEEVEGVADLSRSAQWDLAGRLKTALRDPRHRPKAIKLVERMRLREDLLAAVAAELDEMQRSFASTAVAPPPPAPAPAPAPSPSEPVAKRPNWEPEARAEIALGNKIAAIKIVREGTGMSLRDAKALVESWY